MFAFSVAAQSLILLFIRGYYAMGNTRRPLFINIFSSASIIVFAFIFSWLFKEFDIFKYFVEDMFRVEDLAGTNVLMLAFSYSLGTILNAVLLMIMFEKDFDKFIPSISKTFWHSLFASIIMGFVAYRFLDFFGKYFDLDTLAGIFAQGFFAGIIGIFAGILTLSIMGNRELKEAKKALSKKIWKVGGIVLPEKREL